MHMSTAATAVIVLGKKDLVVPVQQRLVILKG